MEVYAEHPEPRDSSRRLDVAAFERLWGRVGHSQGLWGYRGVVDATSEGARRRLGVGAGRGEADRERHRGPGERPVTEAALEALIPPVQVAGTGGRGLTGAGHR